MLTRLYVHNYCCLVNFTIEFGDLSVIIGSNGTGKTAALSALRLVRDMIATPTDVASAISPFSRTRWLTNNVAEFRVTTTQPEGVFAYQIQIEHAHDSFISRIISETLTHESKEIFSFKAGVIQLYRDDYSPEVSFNADPSRSALAFISESPTNKNLTAFKYAMRQMIFAQPNPHAMASISDSESPGISVDMSNVSSWIRTMINDVQFAISLSEQLKNYLDGFVSFAFVDLGNGRRALSIKFKSDYEDCSYFLNELSEGQRIIFGLVALLEFARRNKQTLILEEPDNFLSPDAVNRFFAEFQQRSYFEQEFQGIIISHHPQIMDQMKMDVGLYFSRAGGGHTLCGEVTGIPANTLADLMARGWMHAAGN